MENSKISCWLCSQILQCLDHISLASFLMISSSCEEQEDTMGYQECSVGREVKLDMKNIREEKRLEAEGVPGNSVCMVLLTFFFGCNLSTEEGRCR